VRKLNTCINQDVSLQCITKVHNVHYGTGAPHQLTQN